VRTGPHPAGPELEPELELDVPLFELPELPLPSPQADTKVAIPNGNTAKTKSERYLSGVMEIRDIRFAWRTVKHFVMQAGTTSGCAIERRRNLFGKSAQYGVTR